MKQTFSSAMVTSSSKSVFKFNVFDAQFFDQGHAGTSVPEPATMLLLGSGLIGLAGYGRRKSFKK